MKLQLSEELRQRWFYAMCATVILFVTLFALGQEASFLLSLLCGLQGWKEYARMMSLRDRPSLHVMGYVFVTLMFLHAFFVGPRTLFWLWGAWSAAFFALFIEYRLQLKRDPAAALNANIQLMWTQLCRFVMGLLYVFLIFGFIGSVVSGVRGEQVLILTFTIVFMGDTGAYFVGRKHGRRKLWEALSPKKTVEGALGGYAFSIVGGLVCWLLCYWLPPPPIEFSTYLMLALVLPPFAQAGDFLESLMKRASGTKDSGSLMPGHGGLLDRADGLALAMPLVYFLVS